MVFGTAVLSGYGKNNTVVVVQEFGSPLPQAAVVPKNSTQVQSSAPAKNTESDIAQSQVLAQTTESKSATNFVTYNYAGIVQCFIYVISLAVAGILLLIIFLNSNINFKKEFVLRSVLIMTILLLASAIPHLII